MFERYQALKTGITLATGTSRGAAVRAFLIAAGLPIRCVALTAPGAFDTHAAQAAALATGLTQTSGTLLAFQRDLEQRGIADRVLTLVWSEFGRRARENGSAGTDHGAAGVGFLVGTRATGKLIGEYAGLERGLDDQGNLVPTVDFRAMTPGKIWEVASGAELVDDVILGKWFEESDHIDQIESIESATVVDRHRIGYRFRVTNPSGTFEVEQQAYYDVADDQISWLRVICSGYRRVREPASSARVVQ